MSNQVEKEVQDPKIILRKAIEELNVFTQPEASRLEMGENGRLVAAKETRLERVVGLARSYIAPFFSDQVRQEQEKKLTELKQAILQARDIVQSHSALIEKFKNGDDAQRSLAAYALSAIQRYNAIIGQDTGTATIKYDMYNYERHCLLLDQEIKNQRIELPEAVSIKYESHPDIHPAQKMLKELSQTLLLGEAKKSNLSITSTTHKKAIQFMIDTFRMKVIRMIQTHLSQQHAIVDVLPLVKQATLEIDEEGSQDLITMRQLIEIGPGTFILVSGCFKKNPSDPQFMTMPILDSFRLSFQLTQSGFPYPSQYAGWALADKWVEASPLRTDQVPLFQQINQRKKRLSHQLLFDSSFIQKARQRAKLKREVFDQHRDLFVPLHRQLQEILQQQVAQEASTNLEAFYKEVKEAPSPFDLLVKTQQQLLDLFIREPMRALEEEWLNAEPTPLRVGSSQEKFQAACQKLESFREKGGEQLDLKHPQHIYIRQQGLLLGRMFQPVGLQYQSEKMKFSPPLLNDSERKFQACAFQQLMRFMDECEHRLDILDPDQIKQELLAAWEKDLHLLKSHTVEESDSSLVSLLDELEVYFNLRFYTFHPRRSHIVI